MYKKDISFSKYLSSVMAPVLEKRGIYISQLIKDWNHIIYKWDLINKIPSHNTKNALINKINPIKIIWNKKTQTGLLYIAVPSQIIVTIYHEKTSLKQLVNRYFGYDAISDIVFKQI